MGKEREDTVFKVLVSAAYSLTLIKKTYKTHKKHTNPMTFEQEDKSRGR